MSEIQFLIGRRRPMRSYSPGALATIAPWKSAPIRICLSAMSDGRIFTRSTRLIAVAAAKRVLSACLDIKATELMRESRTD